MPAIAVIEWRVPDRNDHDSRTDGGRIFDVRPEILHRGIGPALSAGGVVGRVDSRCLGDLAVAHVPASAVRCGGYYPGEIDDWESARSLRQIPAFGQYSFSLDC